MDERTLRLLTLSQLPGFGPHKIKSLVEVSGVEPLIQDPGKFADVIPEAAVQALQDGSARQKAREVLESAARLGHEALAFGTAGYPEALAAIYDPPPVLFIKGSLARVRRVAIVGSRAATPSGRSLARDLACGLAGHGIEIVSGLARGIDGSAHEGALLGKGTTLAILGSGLDVIYPREHESLARRIEGQGAVISELPPGTSPAPSHFPRRNRIIVGLCEAVIMVEAGSRSGALITGRLALDEGRDVLAVPGRPQDPLAYGPNLMIRDGATLIRGLEDALSHLGIDASAPKDVSSPPEKILQQLQGSLVKSVDQLIKDTGLAPPFLMARLSELELSGRIERLPGTLFRSATTA